MDERLKGGRRPPGAPSGERFGGRGLRRALVRLAPPALLFWLAVPAGAGAFQPAEDSSPSGEPPRIVGREAGGRSFREPGTLLDKARRDPVRVDPGELRRRKIQQVVHGMRFTRSLPAPPGEGDPAEAALLRSREETGAASGAASPAPGAAEAGPGGLRAWHVLVFAVLTAAALAAVLRLTARRR